MNVMIRNISSGSGQEVSPQHAPERRARASERHGSPAAETRGSPAAETRGSPAAETRGSPAAETRGSPSAQTADLQASVLGDLRSRVLVLQREVGRAQQILGGLEGLAALLESPGTVGPHQQSLEAYIAGVTYKGEPVLASFAGGLEKMVQERDAPGLRGLIEESSSHLGQLALELSRFETAQQNSRALAAGGDPLESLKEGIRETGSRLLEVQRDNVLRLLG